MKMRFIGTLLCGITSAAILLPVNVLAQSAVPSIKGIPYKPEIVNAPASYVINGTEIQLSAKGKTNLFNNPNGIYRVQDAPMILFRPEKDFTLSAKVSGEFKSIYDVAALVVYQDENSWAKFCYEYSVEKIPTIVSVVTKTYSDDCNSMSTGSSAYMSVVKKGEEFSFFYSEDNVNWKLIRHFRMELSGVLKAGFAAHGSRGDGVTAVFSEIKYRDKALENMRNDN